ncbi:MAG: CoxG family protein [Thermoflexales bacterium]
MQLSGSTNIKAPRQKVWEFMTDPDAVARCAPGVESMEVIEPNKKFKVVVSVGFGTVKVKFNTDVELAELQPPASGTIKARGAGQGNTANVVASFTLSDGDDRTTELAWTADVSIVGSIAGMATRLMSSVTQNLSAKFFECMKAQVEIAEGVTEAPAAQPGFFSRLVQAIRDFFARLFGGDNAKAQ